MVNQTEQFVCPTRWLRDSAPQDKWRGDGTCTYCGSITQQAFLQYVREGKTLSSNPDGEVVYCPETYRGAGRFFFKHLDEQGIEEFITMLNDGTIKHPNELEHPFHERLAQAA